jgi:hypothetical protein
MEFPMNFKRASLLAMVKKILATGLAYLLTSNIAFAQFLKSNDGINDDFLDRFKDCSLNVRYSIQEQKIQSETQQIFTKVIPAKTRDAYADIPLQAIVRGMKATQLTVPAQPNAYIQYRLRTELPLVKVKNILEKNWQVEFEKVAGGDGMDNTIRDIYRYKTEIGLVAIYSSDGYPKTTYIECNPISKPKTTWKRQMK